MAYEYEKDIPGFLEGIESEHPLDLSKEIKEVQEVYRKAKAWNTLKEILMKEYPEVSHLAHVSNGEGERGEMSKHGEVLEHMDKLDGTNEFSNLLSDLGDE
ncbi:hypothetical protein EKQ61_11170 [Staphylococcus gallinarum]|uniref:Uncharacterized protein n=1 Tax=Staphylococcus gallinarum TaxID=1293 RepID=A0A380FKR4_STAGA|nr:hypothetical protein [Staphylococcus gallinarum]RTX73497.1 hypothetical protein EKQ61_11170 [Staphylococcus gallinarum]GEQ06991.1 hypothetical protein SGA02_28190 [Staphylococcus gallinarum]SUM34053.1 Uncharacterised protein [Staphylococcus gallinarum]